MRTTYFNHWRDVPERRLALEEFLARRDRLPRHRVDAHERGGAGQAAALRDGSVSRSSSVRPIAAQRTTALSAAQRSKHMMARPSTSPWRTTIRWPSRRLHGSRLPRLRLLSVLGVHARRPRAARQWGERFSVRAIAFAAETPPAREVLADSRTMKGAVRPEWRRWVQRVSSWRRASWPRPRPPSCRWSRI